MTTRRRHTRDRRKVPNGRGGGKINTVYALIFVVRLSQTVIRLQARYFTGGGVSPMNSDFGAIPVTTIDPAGIYLDQGGVVAPATGAIWSGTGVINITFAAATADAGQITIAPFLRNLSFRGLYLNNGSIIEVPAFP